MKPKRERNQLGRRKDLHYFVKGVAPDEKTGQRRIQGIASTGAIDRASESIDPKGWDLKNFKKNPVFLWAHNSSEPPIGRIDVIKKEEGRLYFEAVESLANPFAKQIFDHYEADELRAVSVGFMPKEEKYYDKDGDEIKDWWEAHTIVFTKAELLEISAVPVPCNQEALQLMFTKGLFTAPLERPITTGHQVITGAGIDPLLKSFDSAIRMQFANEIKAGRVLSGKNETLIRETTAKIFETYNALQNLLDEVAPAQEPDNDNTDKAQLIQLESDNARLIRIAAMQQRLLSAFCSGKAILN